MRRGVTLIELIFSMLIIAIVFTVIPKIIFASNKSLQLSMKEDALYNAYSLLGSIIKLTWDENTMVNGKILDTFINTCDGKRVGGFIGSRNCIDSDLSASSIGREDSNYNDVDDYFDYNETVGVLDRKYVLSVDVNYVDNNYANSATTEELKEINATITSDASNNKIKNFQSSFFYHSANLGHIQIKKEPWVQ